MNKTSLLNKVNALVLHMGIGILVFYFLLHPLTMTLYAAGEEVVSTAEMWRGITHQFTKAFSFSMLPMAYIFIFTGAVLGGLSGIFWLSITNQKRVVKTQKFLLATDTQSLIEGGENHYVEFKSSIRYDYRQKTTNRVLEGVIAKTIAGFMNAEGGKLLIGVNDHGEVLGLEHDFGTLQHKNEDGFERRIFDLLTSQIGTEFCHLCTAYFNPIQNKTVCTIHVQPSAEPVYLTGTETSPYYLRTGNATRSLTVKEAVKYIEMRTKKKLVS
jgi:Schlafen, AlbA_2